jgi:hypothetical protein
MNVATLLTAPQNDYLLQDGNWQKADFYDLSTSSTFWNRAIVITLSKTYAATNATALIYLLQKQAKALKIWERQWHYTTPTANDFIKFFIAEKGFTNTEGKLISTAIFWEQYSTAIAGITAAPGFECSKNAEPFTNLLNKEEIIQVTCFDDTWNEQNFLIETKTEWVLFHWSSAD